MNSTEIVSVGLQKEYPVKSRFKGEGEVKNWRQITEFTLLISLSRKKKMGQLLEGHMGLRKRFFFLRWKKLQYIYMLIGMVQGQREAQYKRQVRSFQEEHP